MESNLKQLDERYKLILLTEQHIPTLYLWSIGEKHNEYYTCRPLKSYKSLEEYASKILKEIYEEKSITYVLINDEDYSKPLGKITLFDLNTRNHSAEFGYYLSENNRGQGLGSIMLSKFIQTSFNDDELNLNKLYATTSSNNHASVRLLEKHGFKLDGRLREHYWINGNRFDQLVYSILKQEWIEQ